MKKNKGKLKKKVFLEKKKKKGESRKKMKKCKKQKCTVDYCCNPQCFVCGGNSDSPTPFRVLYQLHDPRDAAGQFILRKKYKKN